MIVIVNLKDLLQTSDLQRTKREIQQRGSELIVQIKTLLRICPLKTTHFWEKILIKSTRPHYLLHPQQIVLLVVLKLK